MPLVKCAIDHVEFHIAPAHLKRLKRPPTCSTECRSQQMRGKNHWHWRGGRYVNQDGYVVVWTDDGYVLEHRKVMAEKLGRPLRDDEIVRHRNHNLQDNRRRNLLLAAVTDPRPKKARPKPRSK